MNKVTIAKAVLVTGLMLWSIRPAIAANPMAWVCDDCSGKASSLEIFIFLAAILYGAVFGSKRTKLYLSLVIGFPLLMQYLFGGIWMMAFIPMFFISFWLVDLIAPILHGQESQQTKEQAEAKVTATGPALNPVQQPTSNRVIPLEIIQESAATKVAVVPNYEKFNASPGKIGGKAKPNQVVNFSELAQNLEDTENYGQEQIDCFDRSVYRTHWEMQHRPHSFLVQAVEDGPSIAISSFGSDFANCIARRAVQYFKNTPWEFEGLFQESVPIGLDVENYGSDLIRISQGVAAWVFASKLLEPKKEIVFFQSLPVIATKKQEREEQPKFELLTKNGNLSKEALAKFVTQHGLILEDRREAVGGLWVLTGSSAASSASKLVKATLQEAGFKWSDVRTGWYVR
jgi:hypothetical protein